MFNFGRIVTIVRSHLAEMLPTPAPEGPALSSDGHQSQTALMKGI